MADKFSQRVVFKTESFVLKVSTGMACCKKFYASIDSGWWYDDSNPTGESDVSEQEAINKAINNLVDRKKDIDTFLESYDQYNSNK